MDEIVMDRAQTFKNIRHDTIRVSLEIHSDFEIEDTKEIEEVLYKEPNKTIHYPIADQPAECQEKHESAQEAEPLPGPSGAHGV